jgi:hypothetical protein
MGATSPSLPSLAPACKRRRPTRAATLPRGAFSANGLRPAQNNYLLDGIDNNSDTVDFLNGTNFIVLPPVDAIQEFKVQTADFSAELGRSAGAVLNATIKSGTNSFHGAAWDFFRNRVLDAADWFEDFQKTPRRASYQRISSASPRAARSSRTRSSSLAIMKACGACRAVLRRGAVPSQAEIAAAVSPI